MRDAPDTSKMLRPFSLVILVGFKTFVEILKILTLFLFLGPDACALIDSMVGVETVQQPSGANSSHSTPRAPNFRGLNSSDSADGGPSDFSNLTHAPPRVQHNKQARVHPYISTQGASRNLGNGASSGRSAGSLGVWESQDAMSTWSTSGNSSGRSVSFAHGNNFGEDPSHVAGPTTAPTVPPQPCHGCLWTPEVSF